MNNKFKVGDKVIIRKDLKKGYYGNLCFTEGMSALEGKIFEVTEFDGCGEDWDYKLKGNNYIWNESFLEKTKTYSFEMLHCEQGEESIIFYIDMLIDRPSFTYLKGKSIEIKQRDKDGILKTLDEMMNEIEVIVKGEIKQISKDMTEKENKCHFNEIYENLFPKY